MAPFARIRRDASGDSTEDEPLAAHDIGRRAASGAALLTAKGAFQQVLGFVSTIVVTRLLLPDQLGLFAIATAISAFLLMLGGGQGMAGALIRRSTAPQRADLQAYVALQLVVMTLLALTVALATLPFGLVGQVTAVMMAAAPITAFRGPGLVTLERQLRYQKLATVESAEIFTYYVWSVVTVAVGWGVWGLATAVLARAVVGTSFMMAVAPTGVVWPRFDRQRTRALLGIGVRVQAVELVAALRDQILVLGAAAIGGLSIVAYWSVVLRLLQAPGMLLAALVRVAFPAMSRIQHSGGDAVQTLSQVLASSAILVGVLLAPLAGSAPAFVPLLLGNQWSPAADVLPLACLALVVHAPVQVGAQSYLWAVGDSKSPLHGVVADAVVMTALGLLLVPALGVLGLTIGLVAAAILHAVILGRAVERHADVSAFQIVRLPVLLWVVAVVGALACAETAGPLVVRAAVSACVALGLYVGLLFLTRRELVREMAGYIVGWVRRFLRRRKAAPVPVTTV